MTSAEKIAEWESAAERRAKAILSAKWLVALLSLVALVTFAECDGTSRGEAKERARTVDSVRKVLAESSKAIDARMVVRAPIIVYETKTAEKAKAKHDTVAVLFDARVQVLTDSTVSVDAGPPTTTIPVDLAIPEIYTARAALEHTTLALHATQAQLADMTEDRDAWKKRAELDEANQPKRSRFGFRAGLAVGVSLVILAAKVLR